MKTRQKDKGPNRIERWLDQFSIKTKLIIIYIVCMAIPLVVTDSIVLGIVYNNVNADRTHEYENIASAVRYNLYSSVDDASKLAKGIYSSKAIHTFLTRTYPTTLDYVNNYNQFFRDTLLNVYTGQSNQQVRFYTDNETIVSGSEFQQLSEVFDKGWYQYIKNSGLDQGLCFDFDNKSSAVSSSNRKIYFFQKLNYYAGVDNILLVELEYNAMGHKLENMNYDSTVYICDGNTIVLSNGSFNSANKPFAELEDYSEIGYTEKFNIYGKEISIHIIKGKNDLMRILLKYMPLIVLLIITNLLLPFFMVFQINGSFTRRIKELSEVFAGVEDERLVAISNPRGQDEIGVLMRNYNKMVERINSLIQIVYKNKIEEQEMLVARQNAELLALHSQINPHFLFNALESIRMHSLIKNEKETAEMVEKLAVMQRQYVEWQEDSIKVKTELDLVAAYLTLQKYRFGDRLSFELDVEDDCSELYIPKLSIVTFVENACVHGIESKTTQGWIFVRIFRENDIVCLEIEDTGTGIPEEEVELLLSRMRDSSIGMLKEKGRVGIVNACLRLKMISNNEVTFEMDSEIGVGTMIQIKLPAKYLEERDYIC